MRLLLIPWFNAKNKHVKKYVNEIVKLGVKKEKIEVFNYNYTEILRWGGCYNIYKNNISKHKKNYDLVYSFSGGSLIQSQLQKGNWNFEKHIFDSGPMFPTEDCTTNYLVNHINLPNYSHKYINKMVHFFWKYSELNPEIKDFKNETQSEYLNLICPKDKSKLIFNSIKDDIILREEIMKIRDNNTTHIIYDNSPHVQHLKYNKEHYIQTLFEFINK